METRSPGGARMEGKRMKFRNGLLCVGLTLALLAALMLPAALPAAAGPEEESPEAELLAGLIPDPFDNLPVTYIGADGKQKTFQGKDCHRIKSSDEYDEDFAWNAEDYKAYVVTAGNVTFDKRVTVRGDVVLILCDGGTLTAKYGIHLTAGNSLTVFCQDAGTGKLIAETVDYYAGIGGGLKGAGGTLNVYGGKVEATGGRIGGAGIGGGQDGTGGTVNVYGGKVKATGGNLGAGIGGGLRSTGGTLNVYGGKVEATGGSGGAGIGGGHSATGGTVNVYGGEVEATGGSEGAGIGGGIESGDGTLNVYGGKVTVQSGNNAAGIGGGQNGSGGTVNIYGGEVETHSTGGAGIGGGSGFGGSGGTVHLYGGKVEAYGNYGIGWYNTTEIEIRDAEVIAEGVLGAFRFNSLTLSDDLDVFAPKDAAQPVESDRENVCRSKSVRIAPFASYLDTDGSIKKTYEFTRITDKTDTLSGGWYVASGEVTATERIDVTGNAKLILRDGAKLNAAQGVHLPAGSKISLTVYGQREGTGALTATAPADQAGIGGNKNENGGTLTLNGGSVTARGGNYGAGVGGGDGGAGGTVTVNGGSLTAYGKNGSAGIGGGDYGDGGTLEVTGGIVVATGSAREPNEKSGEAAAAGIGAGRPKKDGKSPRASGTFKMSGGSVTATPGTPGEGYEGAQAIGVNLADADKNGNGGADRIVLSDGLRVRTGVNWPAADRADGCRSSETVQIEACKPHFFKTETCYYCGVAEYPCFVTFHGNYSESDPTLKQEVRYNTETELMTNSFTAPTGQELAGWNTEPDGSGTAYADGAEVALTEDLELYARWKTAEYTITWKNDDGRVIDQTTVEYGKTPTHAPAEKEPTPDFIYTFKGWTPEIVEATSDAAYTAVFDEELRSYTITWLDDDGSVIDTTSVAYGETPLHEDASKKETAQYRFTFAGWTPELTPVTGDATYTAKYDETLKRYTVTFYANDGTDASAEQEVFYGRPTALTKNTFSREDHVFGGWNTQPDGSGKAYADLSEITVDGDTRLYAQWKHVTAIMGVEAVEESGAAAYRARVACSPGARATVWAARYDAFGRFLGAERKALTAGEETEFTVVRGAAATVRFFVLDDAGAPLCEAVDGPK